MNSKLRIFSRPCRAVCCALVCMCAACHVKKSDAAAPAIPASRAAENSAPEKETRDRRARAARAAAAMDTRLLAAQVIMSGIDGREHITGDMRLLLEEYPAGGIVLFKYNLDTDKRAIQTLVAETAALISARSGSAPLVAVDHEGGSVSRFLPGVADLPPALSYWEQAGGQEDVFARIEADSFRAGSAIGGLGINVNLAPVAEPLNAANAAFLADRSYGSDTDFVINAAAAFVRGMESAGIMCALKHFPGSAGRDPHRFSSALGGGVPELNALVSPFTSLIRQGQGRALMVSHTLVPARDSGTIASLSPLVMQVWLRQELRFDGIIISDDFSMGAASSQDAETPAGMAVRALAAGVDMILVWPPDLRETHRAITAAIADGSLCEHRLREAAARILFEKIRMGLMNDE